MLRVELFYVTLCFVSTIKNEVHVKKSVNGKSLRELAIILRDARVRSGLTLRQASKRLGKKDGLSFSNLSKLERAEYPRPPIAALVKLCKLYQLTEQQDKIILLAEKIPPDVYWKIVTTPKLLSIIRNY